MPLIKKNVHFNLIIHLLLLLCSFSEVYAAGNAMPVWYQRHDGQMVLEVDLFLSSTCTHCRNADAFFHEIDMAHPWLQVHRYIINQDRAALKLFANRLQQFNSNDFSVPAIFFCGSHWHGFTTKASANMLLRALNYCHQQVQQDGLLKPETVLLIQRLGAAGRLQVSEKFTNSSWQFIPLSALMDALTPCSLFVFLIFIAFLGHYAKDEYSQKRVGIVLLLTLAVVHASSRGLLGWQQGIGIDVCSVLLGLLLLYRLFFTKNYRSWALVKQANLLDYLLVSAILFLVYLHQQRCSWDISTVFSQWVMNQPVSAGQRLMYHLCYEFIYLMLFSFITLLILLVQRLAVYQRIKPFFARWSSCMIMIIALLLIIYPKLLVHLFSSLVVFIVVTFLAWGMSFFIESKP